MKLDKNNNYSLRAAFGIPEKKGQKNQENFLKKEGVCYIDGDGTEYTYDDLSKYFLDSRSVDELYHILYSRTPEQEMKDSWHFFKCPHCGQWSYSEESFLKKTRDFCTHCRPVRSKGIITLKKDPYEDDRVFTRKRKAEFNTGITTLIGCNGAGKTTLLHNIKEQLEGKGHLCLYYDNTSNEGGGALARTLFGSYSFKTGLEREETLSLAVSAWSSSEGECIRAAVSQFVRSVINALKSHSGYGEVWLLFDALDSGLSVDIIEMIKTDVFKRIHDLIQPIDCYIIVSSNSWEMSEGTNCFSVAKMQYVSIASYEAYKKAVFASVEYKEKRDDVFRIKQEIYQRESRFTYYKEVIEKAEKRAWEKKGSQTCTAAELVMGEYKAILSIHHQNYITDAMYTWYVLKDGKWLLMKGKEEQHSSRSEEMIRDEMKSFLCRNIFLYENKKH